MVAGVTGIDVIEFGVVIVKAVVVEKDMSRNGVNISLMK